MNEQVVVLTVKSQKNPGEKIFRLHKRRAVLGSATSNDVRLDDASVSPVHAILEVSGLDGKPVIYDLASDTGVQVNGRATVQQTLAPDDKVQIGPYLISVRVQSLNEIPQPPGKVTEAFGQRLFVNEKEDLAPLLLEQESEVFDIFDHSTERKQSLQVVMFFNETILDVEHFVDRKRIVVGPGTKEDFAIPPFLGEGKQGQFELVTNTGGQYELHLHERMKGVVSREGRMSSIASFLSTSGSANDAAIKVIPLSQQDFAKVSFDDVSFFLNFTSAPPRLKRKRVFERDILFWKTLGASILLTVAAIIGISQVTVNPVIEIEQLPERIATILYQPSQLPVQLPPQPKVTEKKEEPKETKTPPKTIKLEPNQTPTTQAPKNPVIGEKPQDKPVKKSSSSQIPKTAATTGKAGGQEGAGVKAKGDEGSRGKENAKKAAVPQQKAARPGPGKTSNAATNRGGSQTDELGLVDVFKSNQGTINKIFAGGKGLSNAAQKLEGYSGFTSQGKGGLGEAGAASGGGGTSMGLGGLADHGVGGGKRGSGLGALGSGGNMLGGKGKLAIDSGGGAGEPIVMGNIDIDAITREIMKHRDEIKYCYDKEINAERPDLAGRVGIHFVIGASGVVTSAGVSSSSLKNANTEGCVVAVIKRIQFPPVRGGGIAEVTFPFVFKPSTK